MDGPAIQSALQPSDESDPVIVTGRRAFPNGAGPPTLSGEMLDHFLVMPADVAGFPLRQLPAEGLAAIAAVRVLTAAMREYGYSVVGKHEIRPLGDVGMLIVRKIEGDEGGFKDPLKPGAGGPAIQQLVAVPVGPTPSAQKQSPLLEIGLQLLIPRAKPISAAALAARQYLAIIRTNPRVEGADRPPSTDLRALVDQHVLSSAVVHILVCLSDYAPVSVVVDPVAFTTATFFAKGRRAAILC